MNRLGVSKAFRRNGSGFVVVYRERSRVGSRAARFEKTPVAVVLADPRGARAFDLSGEPLDIEELRRELPDADADRLAELW